MDASKVDLLLNNLIARSTGFYAKKPLPNQQWTFSRIDPFHFVDEWVHLTRLYQASRSPSPPSNPRKIKKNHSPIHPYKECSFCRNNGETKDVYSSHVLKDLKGKVTCPILRKLGCPICGYPGGDDSHTRRFCPLNPDPDARRCKPLVRKLKERPNSIGKIPLLMLH